MDLNPPQYAVDKPIFQGAQTAVMRCQVDGCGWNACGPKSDLKHAWNEHYRMNHTQEVGVTLVDKQLRQEIWLPAGVRR